MLSRSLLSAVIAVIAVASCNKPPQWTVTDISPRVGTIVDIHGNTGISALPAPCTTPTPAFPPLPLDWWNGLLARQRVGVAVVGYQVWKDLNPAHAAPTCPNSLRTDIYRAFYEFDLSRYVPPPPAANLSGTIAKAVLVIKLGEVFPVMTPAALAPTTGSIFCDAQYGSAFDVRRLPPAVNFNSGMTVNTLSAMGLANTPPIPTGFPAGTRVVAFPQKNPALNANLSQPIEVDITQDVVSTVQQGAKKMIFTITGTTEPQIGVGGAVQRQDAPQPQPDCRATMTLTLKVSTP